MLNIPDSASPLNTEHDRQHAIDEDRYHRNVVLALYLDELRLQDRFLQRLQLLIELASATHDAGTLQLRRQLFGNGRIDGRRHLFVVFGRVQQQTSVQPTLVLASDEPLGRFENIAAVETQARTAAYIVTKR